MALVGLAIMLAAWSAGIMAAILLSPLMPWLVLGGVLAACVALVNRRLALVAALCFAAALTGAGQLSFAGTAGIAAMTDGIAARLGWIPASSGIRSPPPWPRRPPPGP
jgi:hypothetical protein